MPDPLSPDPRVAGADCATRREILQQPATLRATLALLSERRVEIEAFLGPLLAQPEMRIILTGAGTSAFIGESLAPWLSMVLGRAVESIPTTDLVSAPALYLRAGTPTLLVSFGRSGNSPESVAAIAAADRMIGSVDHLIITCNADGALARCGGSAGLVLVLPEATHDRGFAMTSSFTAMMLTALALFEGIPRLETRIEAIAGSVADMAAGAQPHIARLAARRFKRAVFLGSGVFKGLAREAALKMLELTDGAVVAAFDSTMGFRHGPKTIVNADTLIVLFVSNDPLTSRYDRDMIAELRRDGACGAVVGISAGEGAAETIALRHMSTAADVDLLFAYIVPAQLLALETSQLLGLDPDQPNAAGTVNRVVQGVTIHALGA